ncbi:integrase/recombinase xerD homolog isoform X2 [Lytechinus variegatus]|uniref:integrase/recombinase xerD homolog isoform X2 n=1 Tax=Lytechinus variegatus TaxID=7654 RepID=UPI001BB1F6FF|nr:integrase/recombinase xerD homolog isoform X2 [Lytechinus variegatus]
MTLSHWRMCKIKHWFSLIVKCCLFASALAVATWIYIYIISDCTGSFSWKTHLHRGGCILFAFILYFIQDIDFKDTLTRVLEASRAESTVKKYKRAVEAWNAWCRNSGTSCQDLCQESIARYFIFLFNGGSPYSKIETAFYALKWQVDCSINTRNRSNPCESKFLKLILEGIKRILARPVNRKEPITPDMLLSIVHKFDSGSVKDLRNCSMLLLAYAGFLRFDELSNIKLSDIELFDSHMKVFLEKSKTDQFREGAWVIVSTTGKATCPVNMMRRYLESTQSVSRDENDFVFRPLTFCKSQNCYKLRKGKMSYSRCREIFKEVLEAIGVNSKKFGLHSLRAGGATAAAQIGVPDRLFKRHGRWASDSSKDRYVKESLKNKMFVSLNLGI